MGDHRAPPRVLFTLRSLRGAKRLLCRHLRDRLSKIIPEDFTLLKLRLREHQDLILGHARGLLVHLEQDVEPHERGRNAQMNEDRDAEGHPAQRGSSRLQKVRFEGQEGHCGLRLFVSVHGDLLLKTEARGTGRSHGDLGTASALRTCPVSRARWPGISTTLIAAVKHDRAGQTSRDRHNSEQIASLDAAVFRHVQHVVRKQWYVFVLGGQNPLQIQRNLRAP
jgi:hypothetical protein